MVFNIALSSTLERKINFKQNTQNFAATNLTILWLHLAKSASKKVMVKITLLLSIFLNVNEDYCSDLLLTRRCYQFFCEVSGIFVYSAPAQRRYTTALRHTAHTILLDS